MTGRKDYTAALAHPNVRAFLRVIREGESAQDDGAYRWLYGSTRAQPKLFASYQDHPRVRTYEQYDGQFIANGKIDYTTAAGAYQIVETTWNRIQKRRPYPDFSPASQDDAAVYLIDLRGALDDIIAGRIEAAMVKLRHEWASLPGAAHNQPKQKLDRALAVYRAHGGVLHAVDQVTQAPAPVEDRSFAYTPEPATASAQPDPPPAPAATTTTTPGAAMNPAFAIPLISLLIEKIPEVARLFSSGSPTAERNLQAAEILAGVAKDALGARNEQEAVEIITRDPGSLDQVREAVRQNFFELFEAQERSIGAAREHMAAYVAKKDVRTVLGRLTFPELLAMTMVIISALGAGFVLWNDSFSMEMKGMVITAILIGGFVGVREFFFGSSPVEQANNEAVRQAQQR